MKAISLPGSARHGRDQSGLGHLALEAFVDEFDSTAPAIHVIALGCGIIESRLPVADPSPCRYPDFNSE
jgi:hypothetical protein